MHSTTFSDGALSLTVLAERAALACMNAAEAHRRTGRARASARPSIEVRSINRDVGLRGSKHSRLNGAKDERREARRHQHSDLAFDLTLTLPLLRLFVLPFTLTITTLLPRHHTTVLLSY